MAFGLVIMRNIAAGHPMKSISASLGLNAPVARGTCETCTCCTSLLRMCICIVLKLINMQFSENYMGSSRQRSIKALRQSARLIIAEDGSLQTSNISSQAHWGSTLATNRGTEQKDK